MFVSKIKKIKIGVVSIMLLIHMSWNGKNMLKYAETNKPRLYA